MDFGERHPINYQRLDIDARDRAYPDFIFAARFLLEILITVANFLREQGQWFYHTFINFLPNVYHTIIHTLQSTKLIVVYLYNTLSSILQPPVVYFYHTLQSTNRIVVQLYQTLINIPKSGVVYLSNTLFNYSQVSETTSTHDLFVAESMSQMSKDKAKKVLEDCKTEKWAKQRNVIFNEDTNTISVFDMDECGHDEPNEGEPIPLTYQDVSIVPHPFPKLVPTIFPVELNTPTEELPDRLSSDQIRRFHLYFPGMVSLEYFIDRQIIVRLTKSAYELAMEKVGSTSLRAWSCTVLLVWSSQFADKTEKFPSIQSAPSVIPGSNIYNVENRFSTLGVFLKPLPVIDERDIKVAHFTVSAHSFLSQKQSGIFDKTSVIFIFLITNTVFRSMRSIIFLPFILVQQYLVIRVTISVMNVIWKFFGHIVGLHSLVTLRFFLYQWSSAETSQSSKISPISVSP